MAEEVAKKSNKEVGSAFDLLGRSWEIVKNNWVVFAVVNIFVILGGLSNAAGDPTIKEGETPSQFSDNLSSLTGMEIAAIAGLGSIVLLIFAIVAILLFVMTTSLEVKSSAGKKPDLSELFKDGKKYFFRMIGVGILSGLIILGGFILLIIPGFIAITRLIMSPYHLVDKDLGVVESLKQSNEQAKGNAGKIWAAIGVTILVSIGASILGVIPVLGALAGAAVTIAFSLVLVLRYQQLKKAS